MLLVVQWLDQLNRRSEIILPVVSSCFVQTSVEPSDIQIKEAAVRILKRETTQTD